MGQPEEGMMLGVRGMTGVPLALLAHIDKHGPTRHSSWASPAPTLATAEPPNSLNSTLMIDLSSRAGTLPEHTYRGILFRSRNKPPGVFVDLAGTPPIESEGVDVELPEEVLSDLRKRLRRVAGQVQGIERMLDDGRECRDVVTQISAANRALERAGFRLVSAGLTYCLAHPEEAEADGYPLDEVEKMFMRLA